MTWPTQLVWLSLLMVVYTWAGYPAFLWALRRLFARGALLDGAAAKPFVSIIVAVYNGEKHIAAKLQDCLDMEYPRDRLEILVVSDGSTDRTEEITEEFAARDARIRLLRSAGRMGKSGVQNLAAQAGQGEILFLTDVEARTQADALELLVSNFADPQVGLVTATIYLRELSNAIAKGQGCYWRYELFLRQGESDLGTLATASGAALAIRRAAFVPIKTCYGDDCVLPLVVRLQGYRVLHDSRATVFDTFPHSIEGELRARIRMVARNWTGILSQPALLNPLRFPGTAWGLISHKLLRWLTPFFLGVLLASNTALFLHDRYVFLWLVQIAFYGSAFVGWLRTRSGGHTRVFALPFAFCLANLGFFLGMVKVFRSQRIVTY
jgi:cellulose synthase/poly-beta-1,6-N-acetylglucosamine synthase-like glycosyltransferase